MVSEQELAERRKHYEEALPADGDKVWKLLEEYSHIPPDEIEPHLRSVVCRQRTGSLSSPQRRFRTDTFKRDRAWAVFPYRCIGAWRFLNLYITDMPVYPAVIERLRTGDRLLDAGCCFGYVLRQMAADGAPAANLAGSDLQQEFLDLGYELFRDRDTFGATFVAGDMLGTAADDAAVRALLPLDGTFDLVHAASFFHLFSWEDQVRLGERVVRFFRSAADTAPSGKPQLLFGRQVGLASPVDRATLAARGEYRFHHNPATLQQLWDEIGARTNTTWRVDAQLVGEGRMRRRQAEDGTVHEDEHYQIQFAIYRV